MPPEIVLLSSDDDDDDNTAVSQPQPQLKSQLPSRPAPHTRPTSTHASAPARAPRRETNTLSVSDDDTDLPTSTAAPPARTARVPAAATGPTHAAPPSLLCMGMAQIPISSPRGLPPELLCGSNAGLPAAPQTAAPQDLSVWSSLPGTRPVLVTRPDAQRVRSLLAPYTHGIVPPAVLARTRELSISLSFPRTAVFGLITDPHAQVLDVLLRNYAVSVEARTPMALASHADDRRYTIDVLLFVPQRTYLAATTLLTQMGWHLLTPDRYDPTNYPGSPPLRNPHAQYAPVSVAAPPARGLGATGPREQGIPGPPPTQEEERVRVLDAVYSMLQHTNDVQEVEPSRLLRTPLFPHQKKALGFLLMREKQRDLDEVARSLYRRERACARGTPLPRMDMDKPLPDGSMPTVEDRAAEEAGTVSLWRPVLSSTGAIKGYHNLVTKSKVKERPMLCRGAILADDMGLGKTISVIALIAHTLSESEAWAKTPPGGRPQNSQQTVYLLDSSSSDSEPEYKGMAKRRPGTKGTTASDGGKAEDRRAEQERVRKENLAVRSGATLIVCPMSVISNWCEQVVEHWGPRRRPRIYIYHGSGRTTDLAHVAAHDVVLTTYSTLATEFGAQSTWSEFVERRDTEEKRKKRKRKRREHPNPLQRIEWFRIVLDEAHMIKEARTLQSQAVCNLSAQRRIVLTGTPIQNAASDLFALIRFLRLDPFCDREAWAQWCNISRAGLTLSTARKYNSAQRDGIALARIQSIMQFLTLRRTKQTKGPDGRPLLALPPKWAGIKKLPFSPMEKARYLALHESFKEDFEDMVKAREEEQKFNMKQILKEISWLRSTCDHADLPDEGVDKRHEDLPIEHLIRDHGISRDRGRRLFQSYKDTAVAQCLLCSKDLAEEEERVVLTSCQHLFCAPCFEARLPEGSRWPDPGEAEEMPCPDCGKKLPLLLECVGLDPEAEEEEEDEEGDFTLFEEQDVHIAPGSRIDIKLREEAQRLLALRPAEGLQLRPEWSTKIHALVQDLIPFSLCNPASKLYDPHAPVLDHCPTPPEDIQRLRKERRHRVQAYIREKREKRARAEEHDPERSTDVESFEEVYERDLQEAEAAVDEVPLVYAKPVRTAEPIRSVVFSQWTSMLARVRRALESTGIRTTQLDGTMGREARVAALSSFKHDPSVEVLLVSLRSGGVGLNLASSSCRAYLLDPAWNPATEEQALDRIYRLGQMRAVVTIKFIMRHSIEENLLYLQRRKKELAESIGERGERKETAHDLLRLFGDTERLRQE